jgi:hypothetical protein
MSAPMTVPPTVEELRTSTRTIYFGDDVVGRGDAGSPGSDGASPLPGASHLHAPVFPSGPCRARSKFEHDLLQRVDGADTP